MRRILSGLVLVIIMTVFASGCASQEANKSAEANAEEVTQEEKIIPVEVEKVSSKTLFQEAIFNGNIEANRKISVISRATGKVQAINTKVGDRVKKGDVLYVIDKEEVKKRIDQTKTALDSAKANYDVTMEQITLAKSNFERNKLLYEQGTISKVDYEESKKAASDNQLQLAKTSLNQAQVQYTQAVDELNKTQVKTSIGGIVANIGIDVGTYVSTGQEAMTIVDMDVVLAKIEVTEDIVNQIHKGKEVMVDIEAASLKDVASKIDEISPIVNNMTKMYPVKILIDNKDLKVKPDMFAIIKLNTDIKEDVVAVRSETVVSKKEKSVVYVLDGDTVTEREVVTGLDTGVYTEITKGLKINEDIVVKGQNYLENGYKVKVVRGDE